MHNADDNYRGRQLGGRPQSLLLPAPRDTYNYAVDDDATYHLDHLASYVVAPARGMATPADAIVRLRRMATTSGIWTKRVRLRVGARDLVIVDGVEPIERFPLKYIRDAVCQTTPVETYSNIVVITVVGEELLSVRQKMAPTEMHVFHCLARPGQDLVDDILSAKAGQPLRKHADPKQPSHAPSTKPKPVQNGLPERQPVLPVSPVLPVLPAVVQPAPVAPPEHSVVVDIHPELTAEEKKAISLKVLDLCFSDIERLTTRLQEAAKEHMKHHDINTAENGHLAADDVRTPAAKDFFDIFQKIKLCFILLARLKQDIRDPNASELVHSLFAPLELIVDACRDPTTNNQPRLATQITSPLLTSAACELLGNCLSSKEVETIKSLGPAWQTPRNRWKDDIPAFTLVFHNGYRPPKAWLDDILFDPAPVNGHDWNIPSSPSALLPRTDSSSQFSDSMNQGYPDPHRDEIRNKLARDYTRRQEQYRRAQSVNNSPFSEDGSLGSSYDMRSSSELSPTDRRQQEFLQELRARNARICTVTKQRQANNNQEIAVSANEVVELLDDSKNWWKVRNSRGEIGHVPNNIVQRL